MIVATASETSIGALATDVLGLAEGKPPLLVRMDGFTRLVAVVVLVAAVLVGGFGVAFRGFSIS